MIKKREIIPQTVEIFDPENKSLGMFNEYEFNDLRIQIKKENIEGYYVKFNEHKINICPNGKVEKWPSGFFDLQERQFSELFKLDL